MPVTWSRQEHAIGASLHHAEHPYECHHRVPTTTNSSQPRSRAADQAHQQKFGLEARSSKFFSSFPSTSRFSRLSKRRRTSTDSGEQVSKKPKQVNRRSSGDRSCHDQRTVNSGLSYARSPHNGFKRESESDRLDRPSLVRQDREASRRSWCQTVGGAANSKAGSIISNDAFGKSSAKTYASHGAEAAATAEANSRRRPLTRQKHTRSGSIRGVLELFAMPFRTHKRSKSDFAAVQGKNEHSCGCRKELKSRTGLSFRSRSRPSDLSDGAQSVAHSRSHAVRNYPYFPFTAVAQRRPNSHPIVRFAAEQQDVADGGCCCCCHDARIQNDGNRHSKSDLKNSASISASASSTAVTGSHTELSKAPAETCHRARALSKFGFQTYSSQLQLQQPDTSDAPRSAAYGKCPSWILLLASIHSSLPVPYLPSSQRFSRRHSFFLTAPPWTSTISHCPTSALHLLT